MAKSYRGNLAVVEDEETAPTAAVETKNLDPFAAPGEAPTPVDAATVVPDASLLGASADELARRNVSKQMRSGFCYLLHPIYEKLAVSKKAENPGSIYFSVTLAPCNSKGQAQRLRIDHVVCTPFNNPQVPNHSGPDTWGLCGEYLAAEDESFPAYPQIVKGTKPVSFVMADGTTMNNKDNKKEIKAARDLVDQKINETLKTRVSQVQRTGRSDFTRPTNFLYGVVELVTQTKGAYAGKSRLQVTKLGNKPIPGYQLLQNPDEMWEEAKYE